MIGRTVNGGNRRRINSTTTATVPHLPTPGSTARNDFDTLADTSCAGPNWIPLLFTGETVDTFDHHGSKQHSSVPIATCATLIYTSNGIPYILICPNMLWFGTALDRSLINQNQLRMHGIVIKDDPTASDFGIVTDNLFIPLQSTGSTIYFNSSAPTFAEVEDHRHQIIGPEHWDPVTVRLRDCPTSDSRAVEIAAASTRLPLASVSFNHQATELMEDCHDPQVVLSSISTALDEKTFDKMLLSKLVTEKRHSPITPEEVAKKFGIGLDTAKKTLQVTTQRGIRHAIHPIHRHYRTDHLDLHRKRLKGKWFLDTLVARHQSLSGNKYLHVFTNGEFTKAFPVPERTSQFVADSLQNFADDVGVPEFLVFDGAQEFMGLKTPFRRLCNHLKVTPLPTEPGKKNQNHAAEFEIGALKKRWRQRRTQKGLSSRLWDYGMVHDAELLSRYSRGKHGRTGFETVTGDTPDISEHCDFEFGDIVWFKRHGKLSEERDNAELGLWLGVSHRVGSDMCYWILPVSGVVGSYTTVQHVTQEDYATGGIREQLDEFQTHLQARLNDPNFELQPEHGTNDFYLDDLPVDPAHPVNDSPPDCEDDEFPETEPSEEDEGVDGHLQAEVVIDTEDGPQFGRVVERARHPDGRKIGSPHRNPMLDTREYLVEFPDQSRHRYYANTIAENLYSQCDSSGYRFRVLEEIIDHRQTDAALVGDARFRTLRNGMRVPIKSTRGHQFCVKFKGNETEWLDVKTVKESNPIEAAEFAVAMGLADEPAFSWWVKDVLRHKASIISKVKSKYWKTTHMFGIKLPHSVEEALELDRLSNTDYWAKAIAKENSRVNVSWTARDDVTPDDVRDGKVPDMIGFQEIKCHMIFTVKMDFTRKARFVARGDLATVPPSVTCSSVVSRDSVRLAFLIAALNGLDIMACDVTNAYLNAPCREKIWFVGGKDTGQDFGKVLIVTRALCGLKSSGLAWRSMLSKTIVEDLKFESTRADPDVYRRAAIKDGFEYYECIFVYVDDILILSAEPQVWIDRLKAVYDLKEESIGPPKIYLGAQIGKTQLSNGYSAWHMAADKHVKNAIQVVQDLLNEDGHGLVLGKAKTPFPTNYKPELDVTNELNEAMLSRYRQLIGILRWAVELGRLDIYLEVSLLSQYLASPREGHLETAYHLFAYLKTHQDVKIVFDPSVPQCDEAAFPKVDWTEQYGELEEELPPAMPKARGNPVTISCFVDADHAGNRITRRSHTGIIVFVNNAPILFYSKRQNTVETSTFGSELVALRIAKEMIVGLRYKLRMFGVPLQGPANVYCDNQGVVKNASLPESTLSKKHNSINCHAVREAVAAGIMRVAKEDTKTNLADLFTKILQRLRREYLLSHLVYGPWTLSHWVTGRKRKKPLEGEEDEEES